MKEILNEFRNQIVSFIKIKFFGNRVVMIGCGLAVFLLLSGIIGYRWMQPDIQTGEVGNAIVWNQFDRYVQAMNNQQLTDDFFEEESNTESPVELVEEQASLDATHIETVINSFFFYANEQNADLFASTFSPERLNLDFLTVDLTKRIASFQQAMQGVSQNGTLETVTVVKAKRLVGGTSRIVLDLHYQQSAQPIRVSIEIAYTEANYHNDVLSDTYDVPMIQSSVWDLIKQIEQQID